MKFNDLQYFLQAYPHSALTFLLPDGTMIPNHFHITEIGRVQKDFIDCGGTKRSTTTCLLQTWIARDLLHRLDSSKLARILQSAQPILGSADLPVEVEYEGKLISQFPLESAEATPSGLLFRLGTKHTDCLARDQCNIDQSCSPAMESCCSTPGCCS